MKEGAKPSLYFIFRHSQAAPAVNNPTILFSPLGHCSLALPAPYFRCILKLADCFSVLFKGYRREWRIQSPATARFVVEDQAGRSVNQPGWLLELGQSRVAVRVCSEPHSMPDQSWDSESCTIGNYSLGYTNTPACPDCRCRDSLSCQKGQIVARRLHRMSGHWKSSTDPTPVRSTGEAPTRTGLTHTALWKTPRPVV
jgi:hypothetical protein